MRRDQAGLVAGAAALFAVVFLARLTTLTMFAAGPSFHQLQREDFFDKSKHFPKSKQKKPLPPWEAGFFDIHHIRAGSSESTLFRLPDGTSLLVDAGEIPDGWVDKYGGTLTVDGPAPGFKSSGAQIVDYVTHFVEGPLDYIVVTHFHSDHMSAVPYVADRVDFGLLLDRGYPGYDFPGPVKQLGFDDYKAFVDGLPEGKVQQIQLGDTSQIRCCEEETTPDGGGGLRRPNRPSFRTRVLKRGLTWATAGDLYEAADVLDAAKGSWDENKLSIALAFDYGDFSYYEGGDNQHVEYSELLLLRRGDDKDQDEEHRVDTTTPTAKAAGAVDVATLNHHSHGVNAAFFRALQPKVAILQGWCSDQPTNDALYLLTSPALPVLDGSRDRVLFATNIQREAFASAGPRVEKFQSTHGHVVVRVYPPKSSAGSDDGLLDDNNAKTSSPRRDATYYKVFILDNDLRVIAEHGPFEAFAKKHRTQQPPSS
mmetsp:Transcript_11895/g.39157  ORF Transcript_11895/g.39157 Transcript_11895/m.39157 type:complete len:482 (+) Transcript_11895:65-1510(+)